MPAALMAVTVKKTSAHKLKIVVMIAMKFKKMFNDQMDAAVKKLGGDIQNALDE